MSIAALREIALGTMPAAVVESCRLEGFGGDAYAREPIAALFRARPDAMRDAVAVEGRSAVVLAALDPDGAALFADLHDGVVVRLWRLGDGGGAAAVRQVSVPADHDLTQLRSPVLFEPRDHRELAPAAVAGVQAAAEAVAAGSFGLDPAPYRCRVFVRRAFTAGNASAALLGVALLSGSTARLPMTFNVLALLFDGAEPRLIVDRAGLAAAQARPWTPQL